MKYADCVVVGICVSAAVFMIGHAFKIEDSLCESETIDVSNQKNLHSDLQKLMATTFFKIFQVNLERPCELWEMNSVCYSPGCSICECEDEDVSDVPAGWKGEADIDTSLPMFQHWSEKDDNWIVQDTGHMTYVDLQRNPEGYTGYKGEGARKVWMAVYGENCFPDPDEMCQEQRVFYRLLSGLQGCISCHISYNHPIGEGEEWGPNPALYNLLVGKHPDRIQNIYFTYVFLMRAVNKISPVLTGYDYVTGNPKEDTAVKSMVEDLVSHTLIKDCSRQASFNEDTMFRELKTVPLKAQLKEHFRNISRIMDCVHCEKCKLHSKLQVLGIGTALKVLFSNVKKLSRNEVIALLNSLAKFSHATHIIREMQEQNNFVLTRNVTIAFVLVSAFWCIAIVCFRMRLAKSTPTSPTKKTQ